MLLLWYPKCSTCKKAYKYLNDNKFQFEVKDISIDTPSREELIDYIKKSSKDINNFFNTCGMKYRQLNLKDKIKSLSFDEKVDLLVSDGMLIKRPLLVCDDNVLIGFKEKEWSDII